MKNKKNQNQISKFQNVIFTVVISTILFCTQSKAQIITTIAGTGTIGYSGDGGQATDANLNMFLGLDVDKYGIIYVSDYGNHRIRRISGTGIISTIAGNGTFGFSGDSGPATDAQIHLPFGIAKDRHGNIFISDTYNNRIRKVDTFGIITTVVGNGTPGFGGDGGPATDAMINLQGNIVIDTSGNIYIPDWGNERVRKVSADGMINTIAGNGYSGYSGDGGPATNAKLYHPCDIAFDKLGNMYIVESQGQVVRMVTPSGIISSYAGNGTLGYSGDGGMASLAKLNYPSGIAFDSHSNLFIADAYNNVIRKVDSNGIITTFAGIGSPGFGGDGGLPIDATFFHPGGIRVDINDNIYIADAENYRLRYVGRNRLPIFTNGHLDSLTICSDTLSHSINSVLSVIDTDYFQTLTWSALVAPMHGTLVATYSTYSTGTTVVPTGLTYTPTSGYYGTDSFMVRVTDGRASDTTKIIVRVGMDSTLNIILGPDSICIESVHTYTDSVPGGVWAISNGNAAITSTGVVTAINVGIDTISYTFSSICGTSVSHKVIYILSVPNVSTISGSDSICIAASSTFTDSVIGGIWTVSNSNAGISSLGIATGLSLGIDTIHYSLSNLCGTALASKNIRIISTPYVSIITCAAYLCVGDTIQLSDSTSGGIWSHTSSNATISGNNLSGTGHGIDTVYYSVTNICGTTMVSKVLPIYTSAQCDSISGVREITGNTNAFTIYPNPVNQVLTILNNDNNTKCSATILNEVGQIVMEKDFSENEVQLNLDKLATGIYFIRLQNRNRVFYDKIIKQ